MKHKSRKSKPLQIKTLSNLKNKGNEEQFKHSEKVLEKFHQADSALAVNTVTTAHITEARAKIREGMDIVQHRQKLIKLADSSKHRWKVVEQYEAHQLAENSDDEKRIYKAEARCDKIAREEKSKSRDKRRFAPYPPPKPQTAQPPTHDMANKGPIGGPGTRPGVCFACGVPGHWRRECQATEQEKHKISVNLSCLVDSSPMGRLNAHIERWVAIGTDDYILSVIREGYKLPFYQLPKSVILKNNNSARMNPDVVEDAVLKLINNGCVSETYVVPKVVNPLTVAFNRSGKARLVLDCRHINLHLYKFKFRLEDGSLARNMFVTGECLFTFDLKSAYHHVPIYEKHREYLGFSWIFKGQGHVRYFVFNVLPFGVSTAAHIFTKVLRSVVRYWRENWIKIIMYLDDGLGGASTYEQAKIASDKVRSDLISLGFLIADDKSVWKPAQVITWLGLEWNFIDGYVKITQARIDRLQLCLDKMITQVSSGQTIVSARSLASIAGQIISMQIGVGSEVRLRTRYMFYCLQTKASWNAPVQLDKRVVDELVFWREKLWEAEWSAVGQCVR